MKFALRSSILLKGYWEFSFHFWRGDLLCFSLDAFAGFGKGSGFGSGKDGIEEVGQTGYGFGGYF